MIEASEQNVIICKFVEITGADVISATEILENNKWNIDRAVKQYTHWKCREEEPYAPSPSPSQPDCDDINKKKEVDDDNDQRVHSFTFVLPNLSEMPSDFRSFLEEDLIEISSLRKLENSQTLNWWFRNGSGQRLWPLSTRGDGNCLLHAASLVLWGLHDRQLILRNALHEMLTRGSRRRALRRRWRWSESKTNFQSGLILEDEEWQREWNSILQLAAATPRLNSKPNAEELGKTESNEQVYESLEAIHVFTLAHVLKRPIIVVADTMLLNASGEELSPISFGGIYLPLECPPSQCQRSPLVLCYDSSHFSPLVTMRHSPANTLQPIIPITDHYKNLLPLHFAIDPGADFTWWRNEDDDEIANRIELSDADRLSLMSEYMDLIKVDIKRSSFRRNTTSPIIIPCGTLNGVKSLTLNCAFDGKQKPSRIFSEVAQQIKKRLFPGKYASSSKERPELVTITDVRQSGVVVAAKLYSTGHEYMDQMVKSYLSSARQRFEQSKNTPVNGPRQRARLSRSFSTSSLTITCINLHCQQTASKSTNFLCKNCFERQKQLMASFGNVEPGHIRSLRPANISTPTRIVRSVKSNTMPSLSNLSLSSAAHNSPACASTPQASPVHKAEAGVHTVAVHNEKYPSETFTTKVSSVAGADGVTHYYISTG